MEGEIFGSLSVCCFERDSERCVGVLPLCYFVSFIKLGNDRMTIAYPCDRCSYCVAFWHLAHLYFIQQ